MTRSGIRLGGALSNCSLNRRSFIFTDNGGRVARQLIDDPEHHFIKHCKKRELIRENGVIVGVYPAAFYLRPKDANYPEEKWLSGQYFEFYDGTEQEKLCA